MTGRGDIGERLADLADDLDRRADAAQTLVSATNDDAQRVRCQGKAAAYGHAALLVRQALCRVDTDHGCDLPDGWTWLSESRGARHDFDRAEVLISGTGDLHLTKAVPVQVVAAVIARFVGKAEQ